MAIIDLKTDCRVISPEGEQCFFGYYDLQAYDTSDRYHLCNRSKFIDRLPTAERRVFLSRYYFMLPVEETAARLGFSRSKVKSMLLRTRKKLLTYLQEEGICPIK